MPATDTRDRVNALLVPLPIGTRVELHPATDAWMRGDRFGTVVALTTKRGGVPARLVQLDRSGRVRKFWVETLKAVT